MKGRAAILTEHRARNFGSCLQVYALQEVLKTYDLDTYILDYRPQAIEDSFGIFIKDLYNQSKHSLKDLIIFYIKTIVFAPKRYKREKNFKEFRDQYFHLSHKHYTDESIHDMKEHYDLFFYGSDQIWNPIITQGLNEAYFAEPFSKNSIHASYAASIGLNHLNGDDEKFANYLKNFDFLSVREEQAKSLLSPLTDKDIEVVLDPTLIVDKQKWYSMVKTEKNDKDYILVYSLKVNERLIEYVKQLSEEKNMDVIFFDLKKRYGKRCISDFSANPADFITYMNHAKYVVTNSFHGTVFSIIFKKQFICVPMEGTSSRMENLLSKLNLSHRLYSETNNIDEVIDYNLVDEKLEALKESSQKYIEKVIDFYDKSKEVNK